MRELAVESIANPFSAWRKILKDLITYFRDLQKSYDARSKSLYTLSNVMSNISAPPGFMAHEGISEAVTILRDYHKKAISESNKAKQIEEDVIVQLSGLRSDLGQKIKEIKSLSGDFKNNVDKETETTRRAVTEFQQALEERQPDAKSDPFLIKLSVDRQVGRQIEEENYLHTVCATHLKIDLQPYSLLDRHSSTWKARGGNSSQSWWARSRKPTSLIPVS